MKRLQMDRSKPMAVRQWNGLVAVNYPARAKGVKRFMRIQEARAACPDIQFVHVPTYGPGDTEYSYHQSPDKTTHKVSLDVYREASQSIFQLLTENYPDCTIQRASIDEAYIDVTVMLPGVEEAVNDDAESLFRSTAQQTETIIVAEDNEQRQTAYRDSNWQQWTRAAEIAREIRRLMWEQLHFTCSIGIASNKTLAKLLSSTHKPDKQSLLLSCNLQRYMSTLPLQSIRSLGGKLGEEVTRTFQVKTAGEMQRFSLEEISQHFPADQAIHLYNICRGICTEPVEANECRTKSITSAKALRPPHNGCLADIDGTIRLLASDLMQRLQRLRDDRKEWPKSITLSTTHPQSTAHCFYC
jgi:DNA polymerase eta